MLVFSSFNSIAITLFENDDNKNQFQIHQFMELQRLCTVNDVNENDFNDAVYSLFYIGMILMVTVTER